MNKSNSNIKECQCECDICKIPNVLLHCEKCRGYEEDTHVCPQDESGLCDDCPCHFSQKKETKKCVCGEELCIGGAEVEIGGVRHCPNNPCYVYPTPVAIEDWIVGFDKVEMLYNNEVGQNCREFVEDLPEYQYKAIKDFISSYKKIWEKKAFANGYANGSKAGYERGEQMGYADGTSNPNYDDGYENALSRVK